MYRLCVGAYKYPWDCQLCNDCFAVGVKEVVGCDWEDLMDVGRFAAGKRGEELIATRAGWGTLRAG